MLFEHRNETLDTETMAAFETGVAAMPVIYVSAERRCFLQLTRACWNKPRFRLLLRRETLRYADLYQMVGLREMLSFSPPTLGVEDIAGGLASYVERLRLRGSQMEKPVAPDEKRIIDSIEAVSRTESTKNAAPRWAHPFVLELAL